MSDFKPIEERLKIQELEVALKYAFEKYELIIEDIISLAANCFNGMEGAGIHEFIINEAGTQFAVRLLERHGIHYDPVTGKREEASKDGLANQIARNQQQFNRMKMALERLDGWYICNCRRANVLNPDGSVKSYADHGKNCAINIIKNALYTSPS